MGISTTCKRAAIALAAAALLAPSAQARRYFEPGESATTLPAPVIRADDRTGIRGVGDSQPVQDQAYQRALSIRGHALNQLYAAQAAARPDNRAGARGVGFVPSGVGVEGNPAAEGPDNRAGTRGVGVTSATAGEQTGFDWGDEGIGLLGAFGIAVVGGGMALLVYGRQRRQSRVATL